MILLRQKLYTAQDKKVIHELWSNTKGFRKLPKNWEKLNSRDYFRLNNFSNGFNTAWNKGDTSKIDWEDFRTMMKHLDLPETAKGGKHLIEKYTNPELIERYKSIRAHKAGLGKEYEEYKQLEKEILPLFNKRRAASKRYGELQEMGASPEKIGNAFRRRERLSNEFIQRGYPEKLQRYEELGNQLNVRIRPGNGLSFALKQAHLAEEESSNLDRLLEGYKNPELYDSLKHTLSRRKILVDPSFDTSAVNLADKTIYMHPNHVNNPAIPAHEEGHIRTLRRLYGRNKKSYDRLANIQSGGTYYNSQWGENMNNNPISELVNEYSASREGLNLLRRSGATQEDINRAKEGLEAAGKTYYRGVLAQTPWNINNKFNYLPKTN